MRRGRSKRSRGRGGGAHPILARLSFQHAALEVFADTNVAHSLRFAAQVLQPRIPRSVTAVYDERFATDVAPQRDEAASMVADLPHADRARFSRRGTAMRSHHSRRFMLCLSAAPAMKESVYRNRLL